MELKQVQELMAFMRKLEIEKLSWRQGDTHLQLERSSQTQLERSSQTQLERSRDAQLERSRDAPLERSRDTQVGRSSYTHINCPEGVTASLPNQPLGELVPTTLGESEVGEWVSSPMVGTLYLTPGPDSPPFVKVGDLVSEESVVCIVEAMKVMNEIRASRAGRIVEIPLQSENSVEYGTQLMRIVRT